MVRFSSLTPTWESHGVVMNDYHISVLREEAVEALQVISGKKYIDATIGGGGHTGLILEKGGIVLGIDVDRDAVRHVSKVYKTAIAEEKLEVVHGNFKNIGVRGFGPVRGILFDLGVSSHQFDTAERGFSFQHDGALDMRMDSALEVSAKDLVNGLTKDELTKLFLKFGEEGFAKKIAGAIADARKVTPVTTTAELFALIKQVVPGSNVVSVAARVFQALRIAVNDELHSLSVALPISWSLLENNGRLVVITFHSLEDRIVKQTFQAFEKEKKGVIITKKPVVPTIEEIVRNSRSRSAKMRVFEKHV